MNIDRLSFSKSDWVYRLLICPSTPLAAIKLDHLTQSHSEYRTPYDCFIDDKLCELIIKYLPKDSTLDMKYVTLLHPQIEVLMGHTNVIFLISFIFNHELGIHKFDDEFFNEFEKSIIEYFKDFNIKVEGYAQA